MVEDSGVKMVRKGPLLMEIIKGDNNAAVVAVVENLTQKEISPLFKGCLIIMKYNFKEVVSIPFHCSAWISYNTDILIISSSFTLL